MRRIGTHDDRVAWVNFVFLFAISLMPYFADMLGTNSDNPLASAIFGGDLLLASLAIELICYVARVRNLFTPPYSGPEWARARARGCTIFAVAGSSIGIAFLSTSLASYWWLLLFLSNLPGQLIDRRRQRLDP